ncbi:MAG: cytochrome P450 [Planctomycetota bacterium]|jgi:cholest-4-en-3-one 26-monooxygenase
MRLHDVDLSDPDAFNDGIPHDYFEFLRREHPVAWHPETEKSSPAPGAGFYAVTRHADLIQVSKNPRIFSSWWGTNFWDVPEDALAGLRLLMLNMDPPQHVKFRRLVRSGFTPSKIKQLHTDVQTLASHIVDKAAKKGACDFVADLACELPLQVIAELMGVPQADRHKVFDWTNKLVGFDDPEFRTSPETGQVASAQMWAYANELAHDRMRNPGDDLVSKLMTGEVDGQRLTEQEFDSFFLLLAVAGNETTRNLTTQGMLALFQHPDEFQKLKDDLSLIHTAVEEMLRWAPAVIYFRRTVTEDTELGGTPLRKGDKVCVYYASANRDERVFEDPFRFDVTRSPNRHLAFGIGEHFCLGSHLARMELQIVFREILIRLPDIQPAGEVRRLRSNFIDGIKEMPVRFTPEAN